MRVLAVSTFILALIAGASATWPPACVKPSPYLWPATATSCPAYNACGATFCGCIGAPAGNTNATTCLASVATPTCPAVQLCMLMYQICLSNISSYSSNASSPCFILGQTVSVYQVSAATNGFANSPLQQSCVYRTCTIMNASSVPCNFGYDHSSNVCIPPPAIPTPQPPTPIVIAIAASIVIEGSSFGTLLMRDRAGLTLAVAADLATLLQISNETIRISQLRVGSLIVYFGVFGSAGVQPSVLSARLSNATASTAWLSSTQSLYSTVSNETLRVTAEPIVYLTAAPGEVTPAPPLPTTARRPSRLLTVRLRPPSSRRSWP